MKIKEPNLMIDLEDRLNSFRGDSEIEICERGMSMIYI